MKEKQVDLKVKVLKYDKRDIEIRKREEDFAGFIRAECVREKGELDTAKWLWLESCHLSPSYPTFSKCLNPSYPKTTS